MSEADYWKDKAYEWKESKDKLEQKIIKLKKWIKENHKEHKDGTCSVYACGLENYIEKNFKEVEEK